MGQRTTKIVQAAAFEIADNALTRAFVELTGFEPVTSSLRKMRSKRSDQGKQRESEGLVERLWNERCETW